MIVGVAQIVLNVADLDVASQRFTGDGWTTSFRCTEIPNHAAKHAFQATPRAALDMVHFAKTDTTAVEITSYAGGPPAGETAYELTDGGVHVRACDPQASKRFWIALGFVEREQGALEARALMPAWRLRVVIEAVDGPRPRTSVDADGCVLVTVLTTAIEPDLERLRATGLLVQSSPPWAELIAERTTTVAIVEGPSGELVELLQAPRASRDE